MAVGPAQRCLSGGGLLASPGSCWAASQRRETTTLSPRWCTAEARARPEWSQHWAPARAATWNGSWPSRRHGWWSWSEQGHGAFSSASSRYGSSATCGTCRAARGSGSTASCSATPGMFWRCHTPARTYQRTTSQATWDRSWQTSSGRFLDPGSRGRRRTAHPQGRHRRPHSRERERSTVRPLPLTAGEHLRANQSSHLRRLRSLPGQETATASRA
jgi:hypothetical protein